jgi:hypothetical protein
MPGNVTSCFGSASAVGVIAAVILTTAATPSRSGRQSQRRSPQRRDRSPRTKPRNLVVLRTHPEGSNGGTSRIRNGATVTAAASSSRRPT